MTDILDLNAYQLQDQRIDRYLKKQMSQEEETAFENDLKTDADLRKRARFIAQAIKTMKAAEAEEGLMPLLPKSAGRLAARNPFAKKKGKK